jgi:Zn-dependent membrane protease YugP
MFYFDPMYFIFALPALILGLWAQFKVKSAFSRYSKVRTSNGMTGGEVARRILDSFGLREIQVQETQGFLTDNYDPGKKTLNLSPQIYRSNSVAAAGVAAHETGHALQDAQGYAMLKLRTSLVPGVQIGSWLGPIIFMVGLFTTRIFGTTLAWVGVMLFAATAVFAILTLPVEFDASRRAKEILLTHGIVYQGEMAGVNSVLDAAALTYVAGAIQAVSTVLYYVFLLTGFRRRS